MCNHSSLLILNFHTPTQTSTSTPNPNLNRQSMARSAFAAGLRLLAFLNRPSMAWSAFDARLRLLLAFRWYTPWGATGAADEEGEAPGSRSSPISHPPNFIFGNPGQPWSLKINV